MSIDLSNIPQEVKAASIGFVAGAVVGRFGVYLVSRLIQFSGSGIALTCAVAASIAATMFSSKKLDFPIRFVSTMSAYPLGLMAANLAGYRIHFFEPIIPVVAAFCVLIPMTVISMAIVR